jgi:hypothetical protein
MRTTPADDSIKSNDDYELLNQLLFVIEDKLDNGANDEVESLIMFSLDSLDSLSTSQQSTLRGKIHVAKSKLYSQSNDKAAALKEANVAVGFVRASPPAHRENTLIKIFGLVNKNAREDSIVTATWLTVGMDALMLIHTSKNSPPPPQYAVLLLSVADALLDAQGANPTQTTI